MNQSLSYGIRLWRALMPMLAIIGFMVVVAANLNGIVSARAEFLSGLNGQLSRQMLVALLALSFLFFTRWANVTGALICAALLTFCYFHHFSLAQNGSLLFLFLSSLILASLSDYAPWVSRFAHHRYHFASFIRTISRFALDTLVLVCLFFAMVELKNFQVFLNGVLQLPISLPLTFSLLAISLSLWIGVWLGIFERWLVLLVVLPNIAAVAFCTNLPISAISVAFLLLIILNLNTIHDVSYSISTAQLSYRR